MEFLKVCCLVTASVITVKAGHLGGGSSYSAPSSGGAGISSSYGVPSFGDGGGVSTSYNTPSSSYGTPSTGVGYSGHGGYDGGHGGGHDHFEPPKPYEFGYSVKDPHTGSDFKQQETSDGNTVKGQYKVLLPDGRIQIVTYTADWKTGFHADVKYEGEAVYPQNYGSGGHGGYGSGPSSSYGVPSAAGYTGGSGGDFGHGGGVATGSSYNNIGYGGSSGGHSDYSAHQQYGVPGY